MKKDTVTVKTNLVEELLQVENIEDRKKFTSKLSVEGKVIEFEIDSGAAVTIIGKSLFDKLFSNQRVQKTNLKLSTYCKNLIDLQ